MDSKFTATVIAKKKEKQKDNREYRFIKLDAMDYGRTDRIF